MSNTPRLGSAYLYDNALRNIGARQTSLSNLQENLSSGKRVVRASDDPVAAAQAERALTRIERIKTDQRALDAQRNAMALAESTLGEANSLIQDARALIVQAGDASLTPSDRRTLASQLAGLREQLVAVANRKDTNGVPVLSALGSASNPFAGPLSTSPDYQFNGLPGQTAGSSVSVPQTLDGDAAFMFQPKRDGAYNATVTPAATPAISGRTLTTSGITATNPSTVDGLQHTVTLTAVTATSATYQIDGSASTITVNLTSTNPVSIPVTGIPGLSFEITGQPVAGDTVTVKPVPSIFSALDSAIQGIGQSASNNDVIQAVGQALNNIDKGVDRILVVRGQAGEFMNQADRISGDQDKRSIQLEADRSRAEDLDMIKGVSDFQNQQTAYSAALQSYAQIQKLSLFNFLG